MKEDTPSHVSPPRLQPTLCLLHTHSGNTRRQAEALFHPKRLGCKSHVCRRARHTHGLEGTCRAEWEGGQVLGRAACIWWTALHSTARLWLIWKMGKRHLPPKPLPGCAEAQASRDVSCTVLSRCSRAEAAGVSEQGWGAEVGGAGPEGGVELPVGTLRLS